MGSGFFTQNISRVTTSLHNVTRLKIALFNRSIPTLDILDPLVDAFEAKIWRLELQMFRFRNFSHATDFICHFLNLRHLDLNRITWESDNDPYTVRRLRMLEPLTVHGKFTPKKATLMLTWLHIQCPPPKLISATFHVFEFNSRSGIPSAFGGNPPDTAHQWIAFGRCLYFLIS